MSATATASEERAALIEEHVGLAHRIAERFKAKHPDLDFDALFSDAQLGLVDAAQRFDPGMGVPFDAFARPRITGEIRDGLRDVDPLGRRLRREVRQADAAFWKLSAELGRHPSETEVAAALGWAPEELTRVRYEEHASKVRHLDEPLPTVNDVPILLHKLIPAPDATPQEKLLAAERRERVARATLHLSERERFVVGLYYWQDCTLKEIGELLGVTEVRVWQIRGQALERLRILLGDA